jgi:hypothetical protein
MEAWGFTYKTQWVWVKIRQATGYWNRNQHELLLLGARGNVPAPAPGDQYLSAITAAQGGHSEKPAAFAEMIERYFPTTPRLSRCSPAAAAAMAGTTGATKSSLNGADRARVRCEAPPASLRRTSRSQAAEPFLARFLPDEASRFVGEIGDKADLRGIGVAAV